MTAPTSWLMPVAHAAPATPQPNTATNSASSAMFVQPAVTVATRPSFGFSAATKKVWNRFCSMNSTLNAIIRLP